MTIEQLFAAANRLGVAPSSLIELVEATRIRLLGHSAAVNRSHYTAVTSTKAVVEAARMLREDEVESPQEAKKSPQKSP